MEPFGAEGCHSSESGWTMYIGSPIDDAGHSSDNDDNNKKGTQAHPQDDDDDDDESDDSMASDASSGPSHHHGFADFRRDAEEENDENKYCLEKKAGKTQHKQMEGKKVEKNGMLIVDSKDKSPVQGCGKVRKNYFVGKRK
ncbi:hypothetical protein AAZX31_17G080200 [Glycine max]|uniref:Uncharacterized protein n=1 Tax=Glycine max TaxID=3847 RepID=K7MKL1_SOYBN|nr:protein SOB FIVE-LIKE 1 [Glycine max]XP_028208640.1 serine/threonine-protein kinase rio2-like [Glycine soja]XP_028208641.1 serine/threonine-protein kinase rio2-like [Glycine soja]XP_040867043.1 protein SOB FIVE-LIKE 1 [Glycine max]KAG4378669.1 hypothetical protein GLYMA_17G082800v4 [Glycine max]KAG4378670.1 hypothetical protein GLYMA_17G082800v4 [Glycine max]KAG4378671.1 hypothetical protein GLYMA_17G082800v4 [Glycine max]KAG4378672.1 hypothetical protein GLYMA_17G082800v4 [Glycine max]K|eukprot:XP_006600611.1 serine/threonine-protein kinase rio2 [Glycine max]